MSVACSKNEQSVSQLVRIVSVRQLVRVVCAMYNMNLVVH